MRYKIIIFPLVIIFLTLLVNAAEQTCTMELPPGTEQWCNYPNYLQDKMCSGGGVEFLFWPPTFVDPQQNPIPDFYIQQQMHVIECGNGKFACAMPCGFSDVKCRTRGTYNTLPSGQEEPNRDACGQIGIGGKTGFALTNLWYRIRGVFVKIFRIFYVVKVQTIVMNKTV